MQDFEMVEYDGLDFDPTEYVLVRKPSYCNYQDATRRLEQLEKKIKTERKKRQNVEIQAKVFQNKYKMKTRHLEDTKEALNKLSRERRILKKAKLHAELKYQTKLDNILKLEETAYLREILSETEI